MLLHIACLRRLPAETAPCFVCMLPLHACLPWPASLSVACLAFCHAHSVYRAVWSGRCVAVKQLHLPADVMGGAMAGAVRSREQMAVMEAVVSITMSHPNIVQVC